eukprot:g18718.t1
MRRPGETEEWIHLVEDSDVEGREEWMDGVNAVFNYFAERTPGSYIEKQEYMYRWSWDNAQFDFGSAQAREDVFETVEAFFEESMASDFGYASAGDGDATAKEKTPSASADWNDLRRYASCYTMSLGMKKTKAQYALPHPYHVQNLIRAMAARLPQV